MLRKGVFFLFLFIGLIACKEDDDFLAESFDRCNEDKIVTDVVLLKKSLVGSWQLVDAACGLCSPDSKFLELKNNIKATFSSDGTFTVLENGSTIDTGTWEIDKTDNWTSVTLNTDKRTYFTAPPIICDGWLVTDGRAYDDMGYYYRKIKD